MPKIGDLINLTDPNPLVSINQIDPLLINFSITQDQLPALLQARAKGPVKVQLQTEHIPSESLEGSLVFIDNAVNPQTGTVLLKARVPNTDHRLWPGMMLHVILILAVEPHARTIPASALQIDQKGHFIYCILNGKLRIRRVQVSRQIDSWAVIREGLDEKDLVLIQVAPNLVEGMSVRLLEHPSPAPSGHPLLQRERDTASKARG